MNSFCTISTYSHLYKTYALADSIATYDGQLCVLLADIKKNEIISAPSNTIFFDLSDIDDEIGFKIIEKYKQKSDALRWSLKAIFLKKLLSSFNEVVYVDNDIYFFSNFQFLFDDLKKYDILLTPHHYPSNPLQNQNWFEANYRVGLYNAGFFAANINATDILDWWANCCLYRCEKNYFRGLFDDQKYLDLVPIIHQNTNVLVHKGCNVAEWNTLTSKREYINGEVIINQKFPVVFYHFNNYSLNEIDKQDPLFIKYFDSLKTHKPSLILSDLITKESFVSKIKLFIWKILNKWNGTD